MDRLTIKLSKPPGDHRAGKRTKNLAKIALGCLLLFIINDSAIADNSKFSGTFTLDLTVGSPVCRQSSGSIVIGSNSRQRGEVYYLHIPAEERQETYTFTKDNGEVYTRTITVLDDSRFRFFQKKTMSASSTITELVFIYSNDFLGFVATGSETGGSSCKGPAIYVGNKMGGEQVWFQSRRR